MLRNIAYYSPRTAYYSIIIRQNFAENEENSIPTTVNSRYSGPLNCGHLDIAATYLGTDLKLHQDCTNLVSDLRSPRYSVLQPLLETPISVIVFILQPEVMFVGVVMVKT